jgi:hypothetical protein
MNSSARLHSPLNMSGVFPTNLSLLPPVAGAGGIGTGGPPPGGPPPGGPPPGGPNGPPGGPPHGGPPPPPYIYLPGSGILPLCGLIHPNGT